MTTAITVGWTPPKNQAVKVRGYTIGYGVGVPDTYKKIVDANQRYYLIESLSKYLSYL